MSGFTDAALEKKLGELNQSQQSIQTLSLWLIHHRKHHKTIVKVWFKELKKAKPSKKLTFMYLANDIIQNSKKKGPEFSKEFSTVLSKAFGHVYNSISDEKMKTSLDRIIDIWEQRNVYDGTIICGLRPSKNQHRSENSSKKRGSNEENKVDKKSEKMKMLAKDLEPPPPPKRKVVVVKEEESEGEKSPPGEPPDADKLIKALQDLENSPSTDAVVREKIASLPPEVSDVSLLEKIQDGESAGKLRVQVDEACAMLTEYNSRLAKELDDRKQLSKMLSDFTRATREQIAATETKIEDYDSKLRRVSQVRDELKSHLQNLPDLTLLPNVTGGLAPLPSAGDLFNQQFI